MDKAKLKNKEISVLYDKEVNIIIEKGKRTINFLIDNPMDEELIKYYLNNVKEAVYIECSDGTKMSLVNFSYITKQIDDKMKISVKGQFLYIGKDFINKAPLSSDKLKIVFGHETILDINKKMKEILKEECEFKINESTIKFDKQSVIIEEYNVENIDLYELYEIMWIVYGFFPPINYLEYIDGEEKITEYIEFVYNRVSNREHFLEMNRIVNISKIDDLSKVIDNWRKIKSKYGETFTNFLFHTTSYYSKYINIQLCNVLQALDGYTDIMHSKSEESEEDKESEKIEVVEDLIQYLKKLDKGYEFKESLEKALESLKRISLKKRIDKFIEENDKYDIFQEEKNLSIKFKDKENKCKIFLKYNKFLNEAVEQRNALSHIKDVKEWDCTKIKMYYWKLLLLIRISLILQIMPEEVIEKDNIKKQCDSIFNWYIKYNDGCIECTYNKKESCEIFERKI